MSENLPEPLANPFDHEVAPVRCSRWRGGLVIGAVVTALAAGVWGGVALANPDGAMNWWAYDTVDGQGESGPYYLEQCQDYVAERRASGYSEADCWEEEGADYNLDVDDVDRAFAVDGHSDGSTDLDLLLRQLKADGATLPSDNWIPSKPTSGFPEARPIDIGAQPAPGETRLPIFAYKETLVATDEKCVVQEDIVNPYTGEVIARAGDEPVIYRIERRPLEFGETYEWLDLSNVWLRCPQPGDPVEGSGGGE